MFFLLRSFQVRVVVVTFFVVSGALQVFGAATRAEVDQMAQAMLKQLPDGKLTLDFLLSQAKSRSESYAAIQTLDSTAVAAVLGADAPYDTVFTSQVLKSNDELEKGNPFEPTRLEITSFRLGLRKYFRTGTTLDFGAAAGPTELSFPAGIPGSPSAISYNSTRFDLGLKQNLWRDSFGSASRLGLKAGELSAEGQKQQKRAEIENWTLTIVEQFYAAWLAQSQVKDARENVEKRKRLRNVTRLRVSRGNAEKPDTLAAEAAVVSAEVDLRSAQERLQESWLLLATVLKLPQSIAAQVDPMQIPLALDPPDQSAGVICSSKSQPMGSAKQLRARFDSQRSEVEARRAEIEGRPDLSLNARYFSNGIDSAFSNSASEASRLLHPGWEVGLSLEWPLGMSAAEARRIEARSLKARADAQSQALLDQESIAWSVRCGELTRRTADLNNLRENAKRQSERANLEQYRFSIGRIRMDEVTRAEDDALFANARARLEEVDLRRTIWAIRELNGEISERVEALP